jgi:hypothetical protein
VCVCVCMCAHACACAHLPALMHAWVHAWACVYADEVYMLPAVYVAVCMHVCSSVWHAGAAGKSSVLVEIGCSFICKLQGFAWRTGGECWQG